MTPHLCILTLAFAPIVWGQTRPATAPASQAVQTLKFQVASVSDGIRWQGERSPREIIHPTWAAEVVLTQRADGSYSMDSAASWVQQFGSQIEGLSDKQRIFLQQHVYATESGTRILAARIDYAWTFFAVSQEDARQMAQQFVNYLNGQAQKRLDDARRRLQTSVELLKEAPPHIEEYNAREKQAMERITSLTGKPVIFTNAWPKAIEEGKATLKGLEIERTGQLARLRKIQEYLGERATPHQPDRSPTTQPNPAVLTALETLLVELNVEMAGTQAKIDAVEKDIAPFRELLQLAAQKDDAYQNGIDWQRKLDEARQNVQIMPQALADPPAYMRPVQVKDDTVRIVPVRAAPETQPAP
jgi:hypothetical protein